MDVLIHIGLGIVLSIIGSIPFGTINVTVVESAITRGMRTAAWVILGAAIIEFIQAFLALKFTNLITSYPLTEIILFWLSIPIFIGLGIYFIRQKKQEGKEPHAESRSRGFMKGVIVSSLNVLAIPYWVFYSTYLTSVQLIDIAKDINIFYFSFGVFSGTVGILFLYARLGIYAKEKFGRITHYIGPAVGYFFLALAVIQIFRVCMRFF